MRVLRGGRGAGRPARRHAAGAGTPQPADPGPPQPVPKFSLDSTPIQLIQFNRIELSAMARAIDGTGPFTGVCGHQRHRGVAVVFFRLLRYKEI